METFLECEDNKVCCYFLNLLEGHTVVHSEDAMESEKTFSDICPDPASLMSFHVSHSYFSHPLVLWLCQSVS